MDQYPSFPGLVPEPPKISVTEPIQRAIDQTRRMLFPIRAAKWFTLGFVAWLAYLGEGGGSGFNLPSSGRSGPGGGLRPAMDWLADNVSLVVTLVVVTLVVGVLIGALLIWVSSRGKLMFIDCIVRDVAEVEAPWRRYRERGMDLFRVRFVLSLLELAVVLLGLGLGGFLAFGDLARGELGHAAMVGLVIGLGVILVGSVPLGIAGALIEDFVVPAMYKNDEPVGPAWQRVKTEVVRGNVGTIVLFYLVKFLIGLVAGVIAVAAICLTCCLAALPYLSSVVLLPVFVFTRAYSLYFLEQFGPSWKFFPDEPSALAE